MFVGVGVLMVSEVVTYAGLTNAAMGRAGDAACRVMNVLMCFGIMVSYLIFIVEMMKVVVFVFGVSVFGVLSTTASMFAFVGSFMIALSWLCEMSGVVVIFVVGIVLVVVGMVVMMVMVLFNLL